MAFPWALVLFVASTTYQINQQKKMKKKAEARRQQMLGFELSVEKRPIHLPRVYGMGAVSGVRSQHSVSDSITTVAPPLGSDFQDYLHPFDDWTGYRTHTGDKKEYLHVQQALAIGSISEIVDVTVDENDWDSSDAGFSHFIRASLSGGVADPNAQGSGIKNWDSNLFGGCSWLSMIFWLNRDDPQYNGVPEVRVWYKGTAVNGIEHDIGTGAYSLTASKSYSHNPALCLLDYLTAPTSEGGCGYAVEDVDLESFYRVAQLSDTKVVLNAPVRGRLNGVRPVKDGDTDPGPTSRDLSLYECHLAIDTEAPRRDNINRFLQCMNAANLVWSEGRYKLIAEYPTTQAQMDALVSAHYTDEDVILGSNIEITHPNAEDRLQRATVRFKNESTDLVEDSVAWPKRNSSVHTQHLAEDNGIVSETEVEFEGCINRKLALAKAEYLVRQSRNNKTVSFEIKTDGWVHEQGDFIKITSVTANIVDEIYQIEKIRVTSQNTVQITARRFNWQDLSWNVDDNFVEPTSTFYGSQVPNPSNLVWNSGSRSGENANGWLSWDAPSRARRFHVAHRLTNETEWTHLGETNASYFDIPADLNDGQDRYFIVRTETAGGRLSDGAIILADLMPNLVPVSNIQKTKTGAGVRLTWDNANPELVSAYKVWINTVDVRGSASLHDTVTGTAVELTDLPVQAHYAWIDTHGYSGAVAAQSTATAIGPLDLHVEGSKLDANTIAWSSLALGVRDQIDSAGDANQSAANALASELAANTFMHVANTHAVAANTSATEAATSASNAAGSVSAAASSASAASVSETNAGTSAAASASYATSASTSAGQAQTYRDEAAVSASNALGSENAAAISEGVAVQAKDSIIELSANPHFEFGKDAWGKLSGSGDWANVTVGNGPTANSALSVNELLWVQSTRNTPVDTSRTYRVRVRFKAEGGQSRIYGGVVTLDSNGNVQTGGAGTHRYCAASGVYVPDDGQWHEYTGEISGEGDLHTNFRAGTAFVKPMFIVNYTGSTSTRTLVDYCYIEDVNESALAAGSASAAATSASAASASETAAGSSATAASSSQTAAETAKSLAETYKNNAAASATSASDSASAAGVIEGTVAKLIGSENFPNPVMKDWGTTYPKGMSGVTEANKTFSFNQTNGGKYYGYVQFTVNTTGGTHNRPYIETGSTFTDGLSGIPTDANKVDGIRITAEVEKRSGSWGGACLRVSWRPKGTGGTWGSVYYYLGDNLGTKNNDIQTVEFDAFKPSSFVPGSDGSEIRVYAFGSSTYDSHSVQTVQWRLHRLSVKTLTKGAASYIQQQSIADIKGNLSAKIGLLATANTANAELTLAALSDGTADFSQARIRADQILLEGSVGARQLTLNEGLEIKPGGSFNLGKQGAADFTKDGIWLGRDGSNGFGFLAGREASGRQEYLSMTKDTGLILKNAKFLLGAGVSTNQTVTTSQTIDLGNAQKVSFTAVAGGGGGGGSGAAGTALQGGTGGDTIVELLDGATVIETWTASGGVGGFGGYHPGGFGWGQASAMTPDYGDGGKGASGWTESDGNEDNPSYTHYPGGDGGDAGQDLSVTDHDTSNLTDPKLRFTIGAGGAGGQKGTGSQAADGTSGKSGAVQMSYNADQDIPAGPIAVKPTISGTFSYTGTSYKLLPDPGDIKTGIWVLSRLPYRTTIDPRDGSPLIEEVGPRAGEYFVSGGFTFVTGHRPRMKSPVSGTTDIDYWFYPIGAS